jgi:hypothetical protein
MSCQRFPPPKSLEEHVVDVGQNLKERIADKVKGIVSQQEKRQESRSDLEFWSHWFAIAAVALGLLAIALAVCSMLKREPRTYAGLAASLGIGAIAFQTTILVIGLIIALYIVFKLLEYINIF